MIGRTLVTARYEKFVTRGNILREIFFGGWTKIWSSNLDRTFTADFAVYGERAQNPKNAEVDIFVAVK